MARPKEVFDSRLAERAKADLAGLDPNMVARKLQAIQSAAEYPIEVVADINGVAASTIWRWGIAYKEHGLEGIQPKPKTPKPSKLNQNQKATVLSWIDKCETGKAEKVHWTLKLLRHAIEEEFGVTLGINTIWVWLRKEGMTLKVPRPRHYKADKQAQEDFKKNSRQKQDGIQKPLSFSLTKAGLV